MSSSLYPLLYDLLFVLLLAGAAWLGHRRGFLASLVLLVGGLLAILGAAWAAQAFAPAIGDAFLSPFLTRQVTLALAEAGGDAAAALENFTFLPDSARAALESVLSSFSDDAAAQTAEGLMAVLLPFVKAGIFLVACLVLRGIVRALASLLRGMNAVPLVGGLNRLLGLVLGLGIGAINCWVASVVIWLASSLAAGRVPILGAGVLNQTVLYQFFAGLNPFLVRY